MLQTGRTIRGVAALAILVIAVAGFFFWRQNSAVEPPIPEATSPAESIRLTLAVTESDRRLYEPLIASFQEEHPHIQVRLAGLGEVANSEDDNAVRAMASSFDVFPYTFNRQEDTQYLLNLRPLLDLDPQFDTADFWPGLLPDAAGPVWAIPTGAAYYLTFYDQSAFDAAGLGYPGLDWTTDDFLAAAIALTEREGGEVTRWGYVPAQLNYSPLLASKLSGPLQTADGLRLGDPDVAAAVQWLSDLFTVHQVSPWLDDYRPADRRTGSDEQTPMGLIYGDQAAMWHSTHLLFDASLENVGITTVPRGEYGLASEPIIYGFAASRGTANPEAAWQLLHFLSRQPPQDTLFSTNLVPARRSVAAATNYWEQVPIVMRSALQYSAENNVPSRIPFQAANSLQRALAEHIEDNTPVAVALGQLPAQATAPPETEAEVIVVPTAPAVEGDDETARITFTSSFGLIDAHRRLASQFNQENLAIHVTVVERQDTAATPLDAVAGSDCFLGGASYLEDATSRAALLSLDPLLSLDGALQPDDFYPALFEAMVVDGQLWGIPASIWAPYIEYNPQIFEEAGIAPPSPDWTMADFLEIAQQLTTGEGESKRYGYADTWPYMYLGFTEAFDVQVVDNSVNPSTFDFAAAAEMVTWYVNLARLYEVQPLIHDDTLVGNFRSAEHSAFDALVREGRVAMWHGGGTGGILFLEGGSLDFEVGTLALPVGPSGYRGSVSPDAYHIMADSPHPQACWEWIKFLSTRPEAVQPVSSATRTTSIRLLPAHIETAESEAFVAQVGEEMAAILQNFIRTAPPESQSEIPDWLSNPGFHLLRDAYYEAVTGQASVTEALDNADFKFSQYRQCLIDRNGFEEYAIRRACIIDVLPEYAWLYPPRSE